MAQGFGDYLLIGLGTWLLILSFWMIKTAGDWRKLTRSGKNLNLAQILENLAKSQSLDAKRITQLEKAVSKVETAGKSHFRKQALLRFNPFEDTGGDQSFVLALLDDGNSGVVISSLHSRNGTRVYAKEVAAGSSGSHQFSKEEREVVAKAVSSRLKSDFYQQ